MNSLKKNITDLVNSTESINDKIIMLRSVINKVDEKAKNDQIYLKCNGGFAKNPKKGQEVGNLMISSIKAKLALFEVIENEKMKGKIFNE